MDWSVIAANLGAVATTGLGGLGLFAPARAAAFTSMSPIGATGVSEIRATYGGLFAALGIACLLSQASPMFLAAGIAWVGAAGGRVWSVAIDRNVLPKNLSAIAFELGLGLLLLAPHWFAA